MQKEPSFMQKNRKTKKGHVRQNRQTHFYKCFLVLMSSYVFKSLGIFSPKRLVSTHLHKLKYVKKLFFSSKGFHMTQEVIKLDMAGGTYS